MRLAARLAWALLGLAGLLAISTATASAAGPGGGSAVAAARRAAPRPGPHAWSPPFRLAGPYSNDLLAPQIAFSSTGEATIGFGVIDQDFPWISRAVLVTRSAGGGLSGPRRVPNAKELLALAYDGSTLELLTGTGPSGLTCCGSAWTAAFAHRRFGHLAPLVTGLENAASGGLAALAKTRMLAAVASVTGVWVAQSPAPGRFRANRRLTASTAVPQALAVAAVRGGRSAVAWTATTSSDPNKPAGAIFLATGSGQRAPSSARLAYSAPAGRGIEELALAGGSAGPTAGWTEGWYDRAGAYHSEAAVGDLGGGTAARTFQVPGQLASGLTIAADARGDEVLAWKTCDELGTCSVRAVSRAAGRRFGAPQRLGSADPGEAPAAAVAPDGEALVAWISGGHALVADRPRAGGRFGAPHTLSGSTEGSDVTVAFGPGGQALAAWTQGIATPSLLGAYLP